MISEDGVVLNSAVVAPKDGHPIKGTGKWSEVCLKQGGEWTLISVSGRPEEN